MASSRILVWAALLLRGPLETAEGVINILAEHAAPLDMCVRSNSRDFRWARPSGSSSSMATEAVSDESPLEHP